MKLGAKLLIIPVLAVGMCVQGCQCSSHSGTNENDEFDIPDSLLMSEQVEVSEKVIENMVENISSPVETAALIKRLQIPFNKEWMIPTEATEHFNTNFAKALGLGLYGTDLGYLNMYEKTSLVISYISSVKQLADGIQVGQFFDFSTLKRLATNNENLDSLIYISQQSFNKIDSYLRLTNRASLSMVIVAGTWIEGMYLSVRVAQSAQNEEMEETIADQKVVLATLIPLLKLYDKDDNIKTLVERFDALKALYDQVKITYEQGDPVTTVVDGRLMIEQKDKQIIDASPEVMDAIKREIIKLRTDLITL